MQGKHWTILTCLVILAALLLVAGPAAIAQVNSPPPPAASTQSPPRPLLAQEAMPFAPEGPAGTLDVLYDQTDNSTTSTIASQIYGYRFEKYDNQAADDFVVPTTIGSWNISAVEVVGAYNDPSIHVDSVNVQFYGAAGGMMPEVLVYSTTVVPASDTGGDLVINLDPSAIVAPDAYWLSVQANMNYGDGHYQWLWRERTVQSNTASIWQNPPDGYRTGCITWAPRKETCGIGGYLDLLFKVSGTASADRPKPKLLSLSPQTVVAGNAFTLILKGYNFISGATATWNGASRTARYINSTRLEVVVPASDVATPDTTIKIKVVNPGPPGGGPSDEELLLRVTKNLTYLPVVMKK